MTVYLTYAGRRVALDPRYTDGHTIENAITEEMNRVRRYRDDFNARPFPLPDINSGNGLDWQPWVSFGLDGGGTISFPVHDGLQVLIEDTQAVDYDLPSRLEHG